eukprot:Skav236446  [mRNA]  locus=scaffold2857:255135:260676:+ [translate_table: standard]
MTQGFVVRFVCQAVAREQEVWAAIEIQRHWRGYKGRVRAETVMEQVWRREMAAALLQRNLRGWVVRAKMARQRRQRARASFEAARRRFLGAQRIQERHGARGRWWLVVVDACGS